MMLLKMSLADSLAVARQLEHWIEGWTIPFNSPLVWALQSSHPLKDATQELGSHNSNLVTQRQNLNTLKKTN